MGVNVRTASAQHIGARAYQQDAMEIAAVPGGGILAILCDGMGGLEDGHVASRTAIDAFRDCFLLRGSLPEALAVANAAVTGLQKNTGTTLIAAHVNGSQFEWISVGDSPLYLLQNGGELKQINTPHIYASRLPPEEAQHHPERDALTSYVGIPLLLEIDRSHAPVPLAAGDRVILASDGLSRALAPPDIVKTLSGDAQQSCDRLITKVLSRKRPGQDNVSVVIVSLESDVPAAAPVKTRGNQWGLVAAIFLLLLAGGLIMRFFFTEKPASEQVLQPANMEDRREPKVP